MINMHISAQINIQQFLRACEQGAEQNILAAAIEWHDGIVRIKLTGPRSGRFYRVPGTNVNYQASAPGESPASRLGVLRQNYRFMVERRGTRTDGVVGSPTPYSVHLEKGTSRMAPRPHIKPAFNAKRSEILAHLGASWT
jgi:hypothetical protein